MSWRQRLIKIARIVAILAWMGGATAGILLARGQPGAWTEMFVYSYIIPILFASFFYGQTGGLLVALIASLVSGSLAVGRPEVLESPLVQRVMFQILFFNAVALVTGGLAEREKEARLHYHSLFDRVPVGLYRSTPNGHLLDANPAFVQMLGYPDRETLLQSNAIDLYVDPAERERWQALAREGVVRDFKVQLRRYDGTTLWVLDNSRSVRDSEGQVLYYEGSLIDVTEREQLLAAERAAYERAETLHAATRALGASLDLQTVLDVILSELQKVLPYDSASVQQLCDDRLVIIGGHGFPNLSELVGLEFDLLAGDNPNREVIRTRAPFIVDDAPARYADFRHEPHNQAGIRAWLGVPLLFGERLIGMITLDKRTPGFYTEEHARLRSAFAAQAAVAIENARLYAESQKRAEALSAALMQLEEADRLKNQFIQNVSHELRTPLAIIVGYVEMLHSGELGALSPEQQEPVAVITRRARMLRKLVDDLTAILETEIRGVTWEMVDWAELARTLLADFKVAADKAGLDLQVEIEPDLPFVAGDPARLRQVLDNLLDNALKFTPAGGRITVRLHQEATHLVLQVSDTGIGIPSDKLERIFDRFYQVNGSTRRRYGGVGLGLALVKEVVEAHGGQVSVTSTLGQGSSFRVRLPIGHSFSP